MDARKWSAKWRNWNISDIFFSLRSIEGQKQWRQPETFAPYMGTTLSEGAWQENGFLILRRIVLALVTLHIQEDFRGLIKNSLNTLIPNDSHQCVRVLANVMNCDHFTIMGYLHSMDWIKKSAIWVPRALRQNHKNQLVAICSLHLCLLVIDWLVNNINHSYLVSLLVSRIMSLLHPLQIICI